MAPPVFDFTNGYSTYNNYKELCQSCHICFRENKTWAYIACIATKAKSEFL